jgi:hypothetical protein
MKKLIMVTVLAVTLAAQAQDEITVEPTSGGIGALIGVDLLGAGKWKALKSARWYRKPDTAVREYIAKPVARNPGKTLAGIAASLVAIRAAEGKLDDDLKDLWEGLGLRDEKEPPPPPKTAPEPVEGFGIATFGDSSPVYIETYADNISVQTHGDNSPIVIKEPPQPVVEYGK